MKSLTRNWFLGVAGCLILATGIALAEKGGKGGKPGGGPISLDVTISDGFAISSDGNTYSDGVDGVGAFADVGFRLDTDGTDKIIHKNQVRYVSFVFPELTGFSAVPDFPDGAEPGVDVRIGNETDINGVRLGTGRLILGDMEPGETSYAEFSVEFGFTNNGVTENWQLIYERPAGTVDDSVVWGSRVEVTRDESTDSWTISGGLAGMRHKSGPRAKTWDVYDGVDFMAFEMVLVPQTR